MEKNGKDLPYVIVLYSYRQKTTAGDRLTTARRIMIRFQNLGFESQIMEAHRIALAAQRFKDEKRDMVNVFLMDDIDDFPIVAKEAERAGVPLILFQQNLGNNETQTNHKIPGMIKETASDDELKHALIEAAKLL